MNHIAIDLASTESQICIQNSRGGDSPRDAVPHSSTGSVFQDSRALSGGHRVIKRSVRRGRFGPRRQPRGQGDSFDLHAGVYGRLVRQKERPDRRSCFGACVGRPQELTATVHIPSRETRDRRRLVSTRQLLVRQRTQLCCAIRAYFRSTLLAKPRATSKTLAKQARLLVDDDTPQAIVLLIDHGRWPSDRGFLRRCCRRSESVFIGGTSCKLSRSHTGRENNRLQDPENGDYQGGLKSCEIRARPSRLVPVANTTRRPARQVGQTDRREMRTKNRNRRAGGQDRSCSVRHDARPSRLQSHNHVERRLVNKQRNQRSKKRHRRKTRFDLKIVQRRPPRQTPRTLDQNSRRFRTCE